LENVVSGLTSDYTTGDFCQSCSGKGTDVSSAFRVKGLNALTRRGRRMHLSYATEKRYAGWAQSYIRAVLRCVLDFRVVAQFEP
jgi:hypothetical protein